MKLAVFGIGVPTFLIALSAKGRIGSLGNARDLRYAPACGFD